MLIYFLRTAAVTFPIDSVELRKLRGKWIRACLTLCIMTPGYQIPDSETKIIVMIQNKCLGLNLSDANNTNSLCQVNVEIGRKKPHRRVPNLQRKSSEEKSKYKL